VQVPRQTGVGRWYGDGEPSLCFVERKTHREGWKGEESVKERFTLKEDQIVPFMTGELTLEEAVTQLRQKVSSATSFQVPPRPVEGYGGTSYGSERW
jgi:SPX domain protein involved in polyphosphate accumulation